MLGSRRLENFTDFSTRTVDTGSSRHLFDVCVAWDVQEKLHGLGHDFTSISLNSTRLFDSGYTRVRQSTELSAEFQAHSMSKLLRFSGPLVSGKHLSCLLRLRSTGFRADPGDDFWKVSSYSALCLVRRGYMHCVSFQDYHTFPTCQWTLERELGWFIWEMTPG